MEPPPATGKAIWAFQSTGAGQISITEDQALHVLARDNPEWWYVRTDAGEGYVPASYVQVDTVDDENASDAGSMASASAGSAQSSAGSAVSAGSLSRFIMKSPHGRNKKQHAMQEVPRVQQPEQTPDRSHGADAPAAATATVGESSGPSVELQLLKEAHAQSLAKVVAETEQQRAAVERLRASLTQAEQQHALDQLELNATRSALTAAEDAAAAIKQTNEHLKAAATEHALTEKRLRGEIESLRSQLDRSRDEVASLRRANAVAGTHTSLDDATTAAQTEWGRHGATTTAVTSIDGSRARPQSAPADRTMTAQPRWTALDASATVPAKSAQESGNQAIPSASFSCSGVVSRQRRRGRGARQTNMRPQSAPARHSVVLSTTVLSSNPPDMLAMKAQRWRHYRKPPPNGGKVAGVGLGAAAAAAAKQRQPSSSTAKQGYALLNAASEFSSLAGVASGGSLHREGDADELSTLATLDSTDAAAAIRRKSAESTAAAKLQEFEDRVASLLKAPGSRQRPTAPPQPAAVWARLQKVG